MDFLSRHIEALIFCAAKPIALAELKACMEEMFAAQLENSVLEEALNELLLKYEAEEYAFGLYKMGGGYQFLTKPAYQSSIGILLKQQSKKRLSATALETLSIVAYKQPVTKTEMEQIRGVKCDYTIQKLLEKELVEIKGKAETIGRPLLYGTTEKFMEYFGINSLKDLPTLKDFSEEENSIGEGQE